MSGFKRANPSALQAQLEALNKKSDWEAGKENEWKLSSDAAGNGQAVIRFLPANPTQENALPFVKVYSHGFKTPAGSWLIDNCPSTIGGSCPICELNSGLWNSGIEADKKVASQQKRKTSYYANILVVKDPTNPDNNGQVKVFRFGEKIMQKIIAQAQGNPELGTPGQDVTCPFTGSNFILKTKKVAGFANYDDSVFLAPSEIENINNKAYANELISKMHNIMDYISPDKFKSHEELQKVLDTKLNRKPAKSAAEQLTAEVGSGESDFDKQMQAYEQAATSSVSSTGGISDDELEALLG